MFTITYFQDICSSSLNMVQKLETPGRYTSEKTPILRSVIDSLPSLKKLWHKRSRAVLSANEFAQDVQFQTATPCQNVIHTAERDIFIASDDGEFICIRIIQNQL